MQTSTSLFMGNLFLPTIISLAFQRDTVGDQLLFVCQLLLLYTSRLHTCQPGTVAEILLIDTVEGELT